MTEVPAGRTPEEVGRALAEQMFQCLKASRLCWISGGGCVCG